MDLAELSVSSMSPGVAGQRLTAGRKSPAPAKPTAEPEPPRSCGDSSSPGHPLHRGVTKRSPRDPAEEKDFKARGAGMEISWDTAISWQGSLGSLGCLWQPEPRSAGPPDPSEHAQDSRLPAVPRGWPLSSSLARFALQTRPILPPSSPPSPGRWRGPGPNPVGCPAPAAANWGGGGKNCSRIPPPPPRRDGGWRMDPTDTRGARRGEGRSLPGKFKQAPDPGSCSQAAPAHPPPPRVPPLSEHRRCPSPTLCSRASL